MSLFLTSLFILIHLVQWTNRVTLHSPVHRRDTSVDKAVDEGRVHEQGTLSKRTEAEDVEQEDMEE